MTLFGRTDAMSVAEQALRRRGWRFARADENSIMAGYRSDGGRPFGIILHNDRQRGVLMILVNPLHDLESGLQAIASGQTPCLSIHALSGHSEGQVARVCELLLDTNYRLLLGRFERDSNDGEIRFVVPIPYVDTALSVAQVERGIAVACGAFANVLPKIEDCLGTRGVSPLEV